MELTNIFALAGGLALFLYGMTMMSDGLEMAAGNKMKAILERLTANRILGVAVGAFITAIIQSSSATTVMVVGFVNAELMSLQSAVWVIMGANIGTTITGQLIALDISALAPLIAFIGVAMIVFFKSKKMDSIGLIVAGLGILFMGMAIMSDAMTPLRDSPEFVNIVANFSNPLVGVLVGAVFTAIIQSSSASVGILQALAMSGVVTLPTAIYVLFGQNIGTCITAVLASIGTSRNAKRTTIIHLLFNVIGTMIFIVISMTTDFAALMQSLTPTNVSAQIANVHTVFNIVTTIILLPFGKQLAALTYLILPEKEEHDEKMSLKYLNFHIFNNDHHMGTSAIVNTQLYNETQNMLNVAIDNVQLSFDLLHHFEEKKWDQLFANEEYINYLNKEIIEYTTQAISYELPVKGAQALGLFLKVSTDIERIGDHAVNIAKRSQKLYADNRHFSDEAMKEIGIMGELCRQILDELKVMDYEQFRKLVDNVDIMEENIDKTHHQFSQNQLMRLKDKKCTTENSVIYTKILTDFERIGDHGFNIAKSFYQIRELVLHMQKESV